MSIGSNPIGATTHSASIVIIGLGNRRKAARAIRRFFRKKMSKFRIYNNYYLDALETDRIINEQKEVSDFAKFAKQFQPRYEDEKRYVDYEKFFIERQINIDAGNRLFKSRPPHQKKRCECETIPR